MLDGHKDDATEEGSDPPTEDANGIHADSEIGDVVGADCDPANLSGSESLAGKKVLIPSNSGPGLMQVHHCIHLLRAHRCPVRDLAISICDSRWVS